MKVQRNIYITVLLVAVVAVAGWQIHRLQLKHALTRYRAELAAKGEKLTFSELRAGWKPPAHNRAGLFLQASRMLGQTGVSRTNPPPAMLTVARGKAAPGWKMPAILSWGHATNSWEELESDLAEKRDAIELLHKISAHPEFDFGLYYETGFSLLLPHLSQFKGCAQTLGSAAALELRKGNPSEAVEHIRAMLALSSGLEREPIVVSQLARIAVVQITIGTIWDLLQSPAVTEADLRLIQTNLAALEFAAAMGRSYECERAMNSSTIERMRETGNVASALGLSGPRRSPAPASGSTLDVVIDHAERYFSPKVIHDRAVELTWSSTSSFQDEIISLKAMQVMVECARSLQTDASYQEALTKCDASLASLGMKPAKEDSDGLWMDQSTLSLATLHKLFTQPPLALRNSLRRVQRIEASRTLAVTAIALQRYHLIRGEYPADITALQPEFLSTIPHDPVDGQPLRYRRSPDGSFLLYSVGEDGRDDNGDPMPSDSSKKSLAWDAGRDWVWPQPATAEQIETYYQENAKKSSR